MADPLNMINQQAMGYGAITGGQNGTQAVLPKEPSLASELSQQATALQESEEALRSALNRLRGSRPEPVSTSNLNPSGPPTLTERAAHNARLARTVRSLATELAERLSD